MAYPTQQNDETESIMSSTISLGEPIETASQDGEDVEAEAEFSKSLAASNRRR
jgi:hypothetical protein